MPSTNSTTHLKLNKWVGSDRPKMADFNGDNQKIDAAVGGHIANAVAHLTASERAAWAGAVPLIGTYLGDGEGERYLDFGFVPSFGVIFAAGKNPFTTVVADGNTKLYAAFISKQGCSQGANIDGNEVVVYCVPSPFLGRYALLNENNVTYVYIMFR